MTDEPTAEDLGLSQDQHQALDPNIRKQLGRARAAEKERDEALERAQAAERELALARAGIPDSPMGKFFAESYAGELSSEAIRAKATELGLLGADQGAPAGAAQPDPADLEAQRRLAQAGGQPPPVPDKAAEFMQAVRAGKSQAEVLAAIEQYGSAVGVGRAAIQ